MSDAQIIQFPTPREHPGIDWPKGMRHFTCADCGKAGFATTQDPPEDAVRCGLCGCETWIEDTPA